MLQLSFVKFTAGSYLLVEGTDSNDRFYIIQTGKVKCYHEMPVPGASVKNLGPGDFVGVIPCMSGHSQTETVTALTDVTAIVVRHDQYPELIRTNNAIAMKIIRYFAREMRLLNDTRTKITLKKSATDTPEELFNIAEYYNEQGSLNIASYAYYQYLKRLPEGENVDAAKKALVRLKGKANPVYLESTPDLIRNYPIDSMIFADCQYGPDMFIIQDGTVKITKVIDEQEVILAMLKKGDMFGEMALLDNKPRSASAITHSDCKVMVVNASNFNMMVTSQPDFIARLSTMLADRIWSMYRQLLNGQLTDSRERMIDMLALQLELRKVPFEKGAPFQTDFTPQDLVNLAGIEAAQQKQAIYALFSDQNIKVKGGKIQVPDVQELEKQAAFYRKSMSRRAAKQQ